MDPKVVGFAIGLFIAGVILIFTGKPWIALIALVGPTLAWVLSILGVTAATIITFISGGGKFPIVAGVSFIIAVFLAIYSFFI